MSSLVEVTTVFLEMSREDWDEKQLTSLRLPDYAEVKAAYSLDAAQYRQLYLNVGSPWMWYERSELSDGDLCARFGAPNIQVHLLVCAGEIAGYAETRQENRSMHLEYFGLLPAFIGKGLGLPFLAWTVVRAFCADIDEFRLHTCTLDHPKALSTYLSVGFREVRRESGRVRIPESAIVRARNSALVHDRK